VRQLAGLKALHYSGSAGLKAYDYCSNSANVHIEPPVGTLPDA